MVQQRFEITLIRITAEVEDPKLVFVKAHTRIVNGREGLSKSCGLAARAGIARAMLNGFKPDYLNHVAARLGCPPDIRPLRG